MLRSLVDLVIALLDLVRAYAYELQQSVKAQAIKLGVLAGLGILALGAAIGTAFLGVAFLLAALFMALLTTMAPAWAALVTGLVIWLTIGVGAWIAISRANAMAEETAP